MNIERISLEEPIINRVGIISCPLPKTINHKKLVKEACLDIRRLFSEQDYLFLTLERPIGIWIAAELIKRRIPYFVAHHKQLPLSKKQLFYLKKASGVIYPTEVEKQLVNALSEYTPSYFKKLNKTGILVLERNICLVDNCHSIAMFGSSSKSTVNHLTTRLKDQIFPDKILQVYNVNLYNPRVCRDLRDLKEINRYREEIENLNREKPWWNVPKPDEIVF